MNGSLGRGKTSRQPGRRPGTLICGVLIAALLPGCSLRHMVIDKAGDALASGGSSFAADDDPELIRDAAPLSLKLMESLLAERPNHRGLLFATASGFTQYSYAFVHQDAEALEDSDLAAAAALRARAQRLYRRARDYGLRGLEVSHSDFSARLRAEPQAAVAVARKADVPLLYWTAASWAALMSISKDNPEALADLPIMEALLDRALVLDEAYDHGAIHTFLISYEMVRQGAPGDSESRARAHFARATELSAGSQAAPYVALAEAVAIPKQDRHEYQALLNQALAIDPGKQPQWRLANTVLQRRARWLLARTDRYFIE